MPTQPWFRFTMCGILLLLVLSPQAPAAEGRVTVTGSGVVEAAPDEVHISLELATVDDDLVRVRTTSDKQLQGLMELAKKHGVEVDDFKVSKLDLSLSYNEELKRSIFHVKRVLTVRLGTLEHLNVLLAELLKQPDTSVGQVSFECSKREELENEARERAVKDARKTAQHLATAADQKLGPAKHIQIDSESQRPFVTSVVPVVGQHKPQRGSAAPFVRMPARGFGGGGFFLLVADAPADKADEKAPEAAFGLGKVHFSASVSIDFELVE